MAPIHIHNVLVVELRGGLTCVMGSAGPSGGLGAALVLPLVNVLNSAEHLVYKVRLPV